MPILKQTLLLALACMGLLCCEQEKLVYEAPDSSFGLIYTKVFTSSCAVSGCHAAAEKKNGPAGISPILEGASTFSSLIEGVPANVQAANAGLRLIVPNDPDASFLYQKIIFDSSDSQFGAKMPAGGLTLNANQAAFIRQWIEAGAPLNGHVADRTLLN